MKKKQCTACRKVTERGKHDEWYCRYHKKYIAKIEQCEVDQKYQRKCCPICHDFIDDERIDELCTCKKNHWTEEEIKEYKSIYG